MAVAKADRERMVNFLTTSLESSGEYNILSTQDQHIFLELIKNPNQKIDVFMHAGTEQDQFKNIQKVTRTNGQNNIHTAHIFYKDGINYCVYATNKANKSKGSSLKLYGEDSYQIINLRKVEEHYRTGRPDRIVVGQISWIAYYQPETTRLEEGIRIIRVEPSVSDYSHIPHLTIKHKTGKTYTVKEGRDNKNLVKPVGEEYYKGSSMIININRKNSSIINPCGKQNLDYTLITNS